MSDYKFLSDGRKVAVIGKINQTEYIVQEIYITKSGDELPSGENFTAKSLHNEPVQSYRDKEVSKLEEKEQRLKRTILELEKDISMLSVNRRAYSDILKQNKKFLDLFNTYDSDYLADVVTGNIKYCVGVDYNWCKVVTLEDYLISKEGSRYKSKYNGLRMMSLFAVNEYTCKFSINTYADGSGGEEEIKLFKDKAQVQEYLTTIFNEKLKEGTITLENIKHLKEWITIDTKIIEELKEKKRKDILKSQQASVEITNNTTKARLKELESY